MFAREKVHWLLPRSCLRGAEESCQHVAKSTASHWQPSTSRRRVSTTGFSRELSSGSSSPEWRRQACAVSSGEARLRRSHFRNHFASPDQLRKRWLEDRHPKSGGRGRAQLVADVMGTLMQQKRHVVVLTSSDGLECFPHVTRRDPDHLLEAAPPRVGAGQCLETSFGTARRLPR